MILYDPSHTYTFAEFGIEIPVMTSRMTETFNRLATHPVLGPLISTWHISEIFERVHREDLLRAHSEDYVGRLFSKQLETEIIQTFELVDENGNYNRYHPCNARLPLKVLFDRILRRVAGTLQCCRTALNTGFCFYFGGGTHHAQKHQGSGFCLVNDLVVAIRRLQAEGRILTAWVIDVDAHKGDGTAAITVDDPSITTLSIHMAKGWPLDQPKYDAQGFLNPSFISSTIDIPIDTGEELLYNQRLKEGLGRLANVSRPELALVVCGADPYELDELPSTAGLKLTLEQLLERDRIVYSFLKTLSIPGAYFMAGGYGQNTWRVYTQFLEWVLLDRLSLNRPQPYKAITLGQAGGNP